MATPACRQAGGISHDDPDSHRGFTVCDFFVMLDFISQVLMFRAGNGHPDIER
jgi:hypothetical protein